jgi:hypothetical protein
MSDYLLTSLIVAASVVGVYGWRQHGKPVATDALERELNRARSLSGAEPVLAQLKNQPCITPRVLAKFTRDLDNIERRARVEAAHEAAKRQLWTPIADRFAREIVADMVKARRQGPLA